MKNKLKIGGTVLLFVIAIFISGCIESESEKRTSIMFDNIKKPFTDNDDGNCIILGAILYADYLINGTYTTIYTSLEQAIYNGYSVQIPINTNGTFINDKQAERGDTIWWTFCKPEYVDSYCKTTNISCYYLKSDLKVLK